MNRIFIPLLTLLLVPVAAAQDVEPILDELTSPPGEPCEETATWVGWEDTAEVGYVHDSHNCGGVGYRLGDDFQCNEDFLYCAAWVWVYGGSGGILDSSASADASCAPGGTLPAAWWNVRLYTGTCVGVEVAKDPDAPFECRFEDQPPCYFLLVVP